MAKKARADGIAAFSPSCTLACPSFPARMSTSSWLVSWRCSAFPIRALSTRLSVKSYSLVSCPNTLREGSKLTGRHKRHTSTICQCQGQKTSTWHKDARSGIEVQRRPIHRLYLKVSHLGPGSPAQAAAGHATPVDSSRTKTIRTAPSWSHASYGREDEHQRKHWISVRPHAIDSQQNSVLRPQIWFDFGIHVDRGAICAWSIYERKQFGWQEAIRHLATDAVGCQDWIRADS